MKHNFLIAALAAAIGFHPLAAEPLKVHLMAGQSFGIYLQEHLKEPILIIKTAWGGKSLCRDFRPPSAGIHPTHLKAMLQLEDQ